MFLWQSFLFCEAFLIKLFLKSFKERFVVSIIIPLPFSPSSFLVMIPCQNKICKCHIKTFRYLSADIKTPIPELFVHNSFSWLLQILKFLFTKNKFERDGAFSFSTVTYSLLKSSMLWLTKFISSVSSSRAINLSSIAFIWFWSLSLVCLSCKKSKDQNAIAPLLTLQPGRL